MPNIQRVLQEEIARLARKESRTQVGPIRKSTVHHGRDIAALKRQVAQVEKQIRLLSRKAVVSPSATTTADGQTKPARFAAKAVRTQRSRLGLSAAHFGKLLGVSAQSVYNWEHGQTRPRVEQIARLSAMRGLGKREVAARLATLATGKKAAKAKG